MQIFCSAQALPYKNPHENMFARRNARTTCLYTRLISEPQDITTTSLHANIRPHQHDLCSPEPSSKQHSILKWGKQLPQSKRFHRQPPCDSILSTTNTQLYVSAPSPSSASVTNFTSQHSISETFPSPTEFFFPFPTKIDIPLPTTVTIGTMSHSTEEQYLGTVRALLAKIIGNETVEVINCYLPLVWHAKGCAANFVANSMGMRGSGSPVLFLHSHDLEADVMVKELDGAAPCRRGLPQEGAMGVMTFTAFYNMSKTGRVVQRNMCILMDFDRPSTMRLRAIGALFKEIKELAREVGYSGGSWKDARLGISVVSLCAQDFVGIRHLLPYGLVTLVGDKAVATPDLEFKAGQLSAAAMAPTINSGKHVVVIGDDDVAETCEMISAASKWPYQEIKRSTKLEQISSLLDKTAAPAGRGTVIWVQVGRLSCPLPIRNIGCVFSTIPRVSYFEWQSGRTLKGPYIDQREARYQHGYGAVELGPSVPVVCVGYTAEHVQRSGQGTIVNTEGNAHIDALDLLQDFSGVEVGKMALPLSINDEMALMEHLRQLAMMGVVESDPSQTTFSATPRAARVSEVYQDLKTAKFDQGLVSACFIAGINAEMPNHLKRAIIRMGVVSAGFARIFKLRGTFEELVPSIVGPGRDHVRRGYTWLAWGLWESALDDVQDLQAQPEQSATYPSCDGKVDVVLSGFKAAVKLIAKLERDVGLVNLSHSEWTKVSKKRLSLTDVAVIDELLFWAGLYNLVLAPQVPTAVHPSLDLATYSPISWDKGEIGYDLGVREASLLHPQSDQWLGVASGFFLHGDNRLATDSVTLIPTVTLAKILHRWKVGIDEVVRSRYWNRHR